MFDDVYDSDISLDFETYEKIRLLEYCKRCQLSVNASMSTQELGDALVQAVSQRFDPAIGQASLFTKRPDTLIEEKSNELFVLQLQIELSNHHDLGKAVSGAIVSSFKDYSRSLQNTFRASCFATTPFSQLMWGGSYANEHKGFCVEYTVLPNDPLYTTVYYNLFPMIYCKTRPNMTERLAKVEDNDLTKEWLWDIYFHGALRKSIDWAFQNEWRLLLPMGSNLKDSGYSMIHFLLYCGQRYLNKIHASDLLSKVNLIKIHFVPPPKSAPCRAPPGGGHVTRIVAKVAPQGPVGRPVAQQEGGVCHAEKRTH